MNLLEYLKARPCKRFRPVPFRNVPGNLIEWRWSNVWCYEDPVHVDGRWVGSVLRSFSDGTPVGVKIHLEGVR